MKELRGRIAMVTGASRGIGVYIARALAREGVQLVLVARSSDAIERLSAELSASGTRAVAIAADLAELDQFDELLDRAETAIGPIDILINNAGIDGMRFYSEETDAQTEAMLRLDLLSPMLLTRKCLRRMQPRNTGHIVNIASLAGKASTPYSVSYSTAKGGLIAFTHSLRGELRGSAVGASVVSPGFITGDGMFAEKERAHGVRVSRFLGTSTPADVAQAVLCAIRENRAEIVVNPGPMRLMQAFNQLAPEAMVWMQERLGVTGMLRTLAIAARSQTASDKGLPEPP